PPPFPQKAVRPGPGAKPCPFGRTGGARVRRILPATAAPAASRNGGGATPHRPGLPGLRPPAGRSGPAVRCAPARCLPSGSAARTPPAGERAAGGVPDPAPPPAAADLPARRLHSARSHNRPAPASTVHAPPSPPLPAPKIRPTFQIYAGGYPVKTCAVRGGADGSGSGGKHPGPPPDPPFRPPVLRPIFPPSRRTLELPASLHKRDETIYW